MIGINNLSIAYYNRITALKWFYQKEKLSKKELATLMNLSIPAISGILNDLEKDNYLISTGKLKHSYGQHQGFWSLNPLRYTYACISVSALSITSLVVDGAGFSKNSIYRKEYFVQDNSSLIDEIVAEIKRLQEEYPSINRVAVSCYGIVNTCTGELIFMPRLKERNSIPLRDILEQKTELPVLIDNVSNVHACGEKWKGEGADLKNYVWLNLDRSISCGIIMDDKIHRGHCFTAGEIGHIKIKDNGPICFCGSRGCMDSLANTFALLEEYHKFAKKQETLYYEDPKLRNDIALLSEFAIDVSRGEEVALRTLDHVAQYLSYGISSIINIVNPSYIFIGGKMGVIGQPLLDALNTRLEENPIYKLQPSNEIIFSKLSIEDLISSAAYLWIEQDLLIP